MNNEFKPCVVEKIRRMKCKRARVEQECQPWVDMAVDELLGPKVVVKEKSHE